MALRTNIGELTTTSTVRFHQLPVRYFCTNHQNGTVASTPSTVTLHQTPARYRCNNHQNGTGAPTLSTVTLYQIPARYRCTNHHSRCNCIYHQSWVKLAQLLELLYYQNKMYEFMHSLLSSLNLGQPCTILLTI